MVNFLQILAVWGVAVVQPLLGIMGDNTETFLKFGITGRSVLWAAIIFALLPPLFGVVCELAALKSRKVMFAMHLTIVFTLGLIAALQIAKFYLHLGGVPQALIAIVLAAVLMGLLVATKPVGEWLRILAIVPVIAVAMFVFNTPAGRYARGSKVEAYDIKTGNIPIVMLMLDEFPVSALLKSDHTIDAARFPNFARLASTSTWYRNFTSAAETTDYAIPAALSGKLPVADKSFTYVDHPDNLFTWLGGTYKMNVSEYISEMCPPSVCSDNNALPGAKAKQKESQWKSFAREMADVFKQRVDLTKANEYDAVRAAAAQTDTVAVTTTTVATTTSTAAGSDGTTSTVAALPHNIPFIANLQPGRFSDWVNSIPEDPTGTLNYLHLLLPHQSWVFLPDGLSYALNGDEQFEDESAWETKVRQQRMIMQVQFVDKLLGLLLDRLEASDAYKNSLVIVQADHGVTLTAGYSHRFISRDYVTAPDIAYPPLFIHAPGQVEGTISDANVEMVDELAIISNILNTEVPWKMDGMLPEDKSAERASTKTVWLNPHPYDIAPRPEKVLTFDAKKFQSEMFARIPGGATPTHYLDMLYADTPNYQLMGQKVNVGSLPQCACDVTVDSDLRSDRNPLVYLRGSASGDLKDGDWIAFIVRGKVSGLSQIFTRGGVTMFASLAYREDYGDDWTDPQAAKIGANGELSELIALK